MSFTEGVIPFPSYCKYLYIIQLQIIHVLLISNSKFYLKISNHQFCHFDLVSFSHTVICE